MGRVAAKCGGERSKERGDKGDGVSFTILPKSDRKNLKDISAS